MNYNVILIKAQRKTLSKGENMKKACNILVFSVIILSLSAGCIFIKHIDPYFEKGNYFPQDKLADFYSAWFVSPYEYMFKSFYYHDDYNEEGTIYIAGNVYGQFMAGIKGIVLYGGILDCMSKFLDENERVGFYNIDIVERFTGLPVFRYKDAFGYYNPDIVVWTYTYMIPDPDDIISGRTAQEIYDVVFSRFFRLMTESYVYLNDMGIYEQEKNAYLKNVVEKEKYALRYLDNRFPEIFPQYRCQRGNSYWTEGMSFGFWLRRGIDGTDDEFWTGLKKVMFLYDKDCFDRIKDKYKNFDF